MNYDHRYIEGRMRAGDYARQVARDLWFQLRICIRDAHGECDANRAAQLTRQLVYLNDHYDTQSATDKYQGMDIHGTREGDTSGTAAGALRSAGRLDHLSHVRAPLRRDAPTVLGLRVETEDHEESEGAESA